MNEWFEIRQSNNSGLCLNVCCCVVFGCSKEQDNGREGWRKKTTKKKSGKSTRARKLVAPVVEEHVEELSEGNNSADLCEPPTEV